MAGKKIGAIVSRHGRFVSMLVLVCLAGSVVFHASEQSQVLTLQGMKASAGIKLRPYLLYEPTDDLSYASASYVDSSWRHIPKVDGSYDMSLDGWEGVGWFRARFKVTDSSKNSALALRIFALAPFEIYLDGMKIHSVGEIGEANGYVPLNQVFPLAPYLDVSNKDSIHVLAFRVASPPSSFFMPDKSNVAFGATLGKTTAMYTTSLESRTQWMKIFLLPFGMVIALGALHLLLWIFDRASSVNLWYVAFAVVFSGIFMCWLVQATSTDAHWLMASYRIIGILWSVIIAIALLLISKIYFGSISKTRLVLSVAGAFLVVILPYAFEEFGTIMWGSFATIAALDVGRLTITAMRKRQSGAWIIGIGFLVFSIYLLSWFFGVYLELVTVNDEVWRVIFILGLISMPLSMSVFLARRVTKTNRDLSEQLLRVDELMSDKIARERAAVQDEIQRQQLEQENDRKTRELDEARKLQFSMLPSAMPDSEILETSIAMNTATEVGGDYVDYYVHAKNNYTFAIGDATGHGLKAGVMVATAKSHFQTNALDQSHQEILKHTSEGIERLNLRGLYMCLALLTIENGRATWTSSGIPPLMHYQSKTGTIEQRVVKGLPLGAPRSEPSDSLVFSVEPGDVLLLMTDGLPELFDLERESLGYEPIIECLRANAKNSTQDLMDELVDLADTWRAGRAYNDDVTLLALKITSENQDRSS